MVSHRGLEQRQWTSCELVGLEDGDLVLCELSARFGLKLSVTKLAVCFEFGSAYHTYWIFASVVAIMRSLYSRSL